MSSRMSWRSFLSRGSRSSVANPAPTPTALDVPDTPTIEDTMSVHDNVSITVSPLVEEPHKPNNPRLAKKRKRPEFNGTMVKFLVGPEDDPTEFDVHKDFVCYHSPVLDAAFNGGFSESETKTYRLEETTAGAFKYFLNWVYGQNLDLDETPTVSKKAKHLVRLWVLADMLVVPRLQNAAINKIHELSEKENVVFVRVLHYVYENTYDENSPLRKYFVNELAFNYSGGFKEPEIFPFDLLIELARVTTRVSPADLKPITAFLVPVEEED